MIILNWWADFVTHRRRTTAILLVLITLLATWGHFYQQPADEPVSATRSESEPSVESEDSLSPDPTTTDRDDSGIRPNGTGIDDSGTGERVAGGEESNESSERKGEEFGEQPTPRSSSFNSTASTSTAQRGPDCYLVVEVEDLFTPRAVEAIRDLVAALQSRPEIESITWVDTVPVLNVFGLREPLLPRSDASAEHFDDARSRVLRHPLVRGQLLSDDGRTLLMPVRFDWLFVTSDSDCTSQLLAAAREQALDWPDVPLTIRLTGNVPLYLAHREAFDRNQSKFQVIAYGMVFVLALVLFRGIRAVLVVGAAPAMGVYWSLGLLNWMDELSNPLTSVVLPVLLTMVGLTDGVHLMVHVRRARAAGWSTIHAASTAVRQVGVASALTSVTTAIGFGSLLLAQSEFVQGFGRSCALGVLVTFLAVITIVPFLCSTWIGREIHRGHEHDFVGNGLARGGWFIDGVIRHSGKVSLLAVGLFAGLAIFASTLRPDDRTRDSQPTGSEAYQALAHCDQALGGIEQIRVLVRWSEDQAGDGQNVLEAIDGVTQILEDEPLLRHPLSILSILASLPGDEPATARFPFLQLLPESVKGSYFQQTDREAVVTVRMQDLGIARYEPVFRRVEEGLQQLSVQYPGMSFELSGEPVRRGRNLYRIVTDLAMSLGTASFIIFLVMTVAYRSLRIGLITIIPNMFPLAATAAMMVLLDHPLEIASVCSFTVCLGIAVDDTIHFLTRYRQELDRGVGVEQALQHSFRDVGAAMIITTMILVAGFGTVMTSDLPAHRYFATMAVSTITAALLGDLVFLPALLAYFGRKKRPAA